MRIWWHKWHNRHPDRKKVLLYIWKLPRSRLIEGGGEKKIDRRVTITRPVNCKSQVRVVASSACQVEKMDPRKSTEKIVSLWDTWERARARLCTKEEEKKIKEEAIWQEERGYTRTAKRENKRHGAARSKVEAAADGWSSLGLFCIFFLSPARLRRVAWRACGSASDDSYRTFSLHRRSAFSIRDFLMSSSEKFFFFLSLVRG